MRTVLRNSILGFALAIFAASITTASAQSTDPGMGTWKLNVEKSKYSPGPPRFKSLTIKFEPAGKGLKRTVEGVAADGKPIATEFTAEYDGKDYPLKGSATVDTVSLRRIDAATVERTDKKAGKVVAVVTRAIAKDGKSYTATVKGTNAKGEPVNDVLVFEKQ